MASAEALARTTVANEVSASVAMLSNEAIIDLLEVDEIEPVDENAVPAVPQDYAFFAMDR